MKKDIEKIYTELIVKNTNEVELLLEDCYNLNAKELMLQAPDLAQSIVDMVVQKLQDIQNQNVKMVENGVIINATNGGYSLNNHQQKVNNYIEEIIHSLKQD